MKLERNVSLKAYNTFGIDVEASHFVRIRDLDELREALAAPGLPEPFILSGGSNILLTGPLNRLVLFLDTRGKEVLQRDADQAVLRVMAGENWHELVLWSLEQGYGGAEVCVAQPDVIRAHAMASVAPRDTCLVSMMVSPVCKFSPFQILIPLFSTPIFLHISTN